MTKTEVQMIEQEILVKIVTYGYPHSSFDEELEMNDLALSVRDIFSEHGVSLDD